MVIKQPSGIKAPVTFLPVAEMPNKKIFGNIDPLEGSPAREMTKKLMAGGIPLGDFAEKLKKERAAALPKPSRAETSPKD